MGTAAALDNRIAITGGSITGAAPGRTVVKLFSPFTFAYSNGAAMPTALIKHTVLRTYDATNHQLIALVGGTTVNALSSYSSSAPAFTQSTVANGAPLGACGAVAGSQAFPGRRVVDVGPQGDVHRRQQRRRCRSRRSQHW